MKKIVAALVLGCALVGVAAASATTGGSGKGKVAAAVPPISYGVADDTGKYADDGGAWFNQELKGANLTEERWTLSWDASNPTTIAELPFLQRSAPRAQADGIHVVLALYGRPASAHDPSGFCSWAAKVAQTVKGWGIHDFIVWNEPNTALYWSPQDSSAPAAYEALLAQCYDAIHAADSQARVIGFGLSPRSNGPTQTAPIPYIAAVGAAYKASGRTTPIMDQMSIHPYPNPNSPTDPPSKGYTATENYGVPNLDRVKQAVYSAFNGTGQPTTVNGLTFRIDELGWQTDTSGYSQYYNDENVKVVSEQTQADYVKQTVQQYFACDPTVTDVEWFLLVDEPTRNGKNQSGATIGGGWQSGLLTAGGKGVSTPKLAYSQDAPLFAQGRSACTGSQVNWTPAGSGGGTGGGGGGGSTPPAGPPSNVLFLTQGIGTLVFNPTGVTSLLSTYLTVLNTAGLLPAPPTSPALTSLGQHALTHLLTEFGQLQTDGDVSAGVFGLPNGLGPTRNVLQGTITILGAQDARMLSGRTAAPTLLASGKTTVAKGKVPAVKLKALHPKAKVAAGTYVLAVVLQSATDPTKRVTIATPFAKAKVAKAAKKPKKKTKH